MKKHTITGLTFCFALSFILGAAYEITLDSSGEGIDDSTPMSNAVVIDSAAVVSSL